MSGIPGQFIPGYWWNQNRIINRFPANGAAPRVQETDLDMLVTAHPTYDDFWRARCAWERLPEIKVPLYSIGIWGKIDLHTRGNIDGFRRAKGPRKLQMRGPPNAWAANAEFNGVEVHEKVLMPFYDRFLKGKETEWDKRAPVEYFVRGANVFKTADTWPPAGVKYKSWFLNGLKTGSLTSLNDGGLSTEKPSGSESTSYAYPNPGWVTGVVGFGPSGPPNFDPVRRVLSFKTLCPRIGARSPMAAALRQIVAERSTARVPGHKRLDRRKVRATCAVRRDSFSLTMRVRGHHEAYAVPRLLNLVNELFLALHESYPDYLVAQFGLSVE